MTFDEFTAEIGLLVSRMQNEPDDAHEIYQVLKERLNEMRAYGMPLPQDLVELEQKLEADFGRGDDGGGDQAA